MKIKKLIVPATNTTFEVGVNGVTEIKDNSKEFESSYMGLYSVHLNTKIEAPKIAAHIEGLGVQIEYFV